MRVAHVIGYYQPQLGYEEAYLPSYQRKRGIDAIVLTSDRLSPEAGVAQTLNETSTFRYDTGWSVDRRFEIPVLRLPLLAQRHGQTALSRVGRNLRKLKPDVVHCHDVTSPLAMQVALAQRMMRFALVYDSHALYDAFESSTVSKRIYLMFHRHVIRPLIINSASSIIALTGETSDLLQKEFGFPGSMIVKSTLGVETNLFRPIPGARETARMRLGISPEIRLVLYVGKIAPWKRVDVLVEAFARVEKTRADAYLLLIGSSVPDYKSMIEKRAHELGVARKIIWRGPVPNIELPAFYNCADICVWPGASSLSMLEAFACGLPVIVHDRPANLERISHQNGIQFNGSVAQLTEKLATLLEDGNLRLQLGRNALEFARSHLDWMRVAEHTITIYRAAVNFTQHQSNDKGSSG